MLNFVHNRVSLLGCIGAVVFFFLPWLDISCSGVPFLTQSGFESVIGDATLNPELTAYADQVSERSQERGEMALPVAVAGGALILATLFSIVALGQRGANRATPLLNAVALGALLYGSAVGFPIEQQLEREFEAQKKEGEASLIALSAPRTPWFYAELGCLGLPLLSLILTIRPKEE